MRATHTRRVRWLLVGAAALAVAIYACRPRAALATERNDAAPEQDRTAVVGGIRMRWEEHGPAEGRPVVLVHGLPTNPRAWRYVVPRIAGPDTRCLAWELVGFGESFREGFGRDLSIPAQAAHLRAWLDHLGIGQAVFVGHDYGGGVIQQLAVSDPGRFAGVVLSDSVAFDNWPVAGVRVARAMRGLVPHLPGFAARALFQAALANLGHADPQVGAVSSDLFWRPYARKDGLRAFAHQLGFFDNRDTQRIGAALRPLGCPSLVVWGERDPLGLPSAQELARRLGAGLRVIPGAYHFTIEDHPDRIAEAIHEVLGHARQHHRGT
ncbi:alpha/beta fold hydrolase [Geminicoccus harenae]|uniref:alpha/beta fold hydrolase n=1 Tax=Geminicoccus harenae TaxID=2498453 RepID=UPI001C95A375|nr:alpha/beta fold hydrolase [Geminicoccus harenae]